MTSLKARRSLFEELSHTQTKDSEILSLLGELKLIDYDYIQRQESVLGMIEDRYNKLSEIDAVIPLSDYLNLANKE